MNVDARELIRTCEPCQKNARSHRQDKIETPQKNMFNQHPNHTVHVDFCDYGGRDYIVVVDRVTGYIRAEQTPNQGTDAAIKVIQNWSLLFGYPLLVISDSGGGFRKTFKEKLKKLNVRHKHSSAYHPQSNSLAERAVGSLKHSLKKSPKHISKLNLKEIIFEINSTVSQEMTGSANNRFLMRSVRSLLPNSIDPQLDPKELIRRRILNHEGKIKNKNQNNKVIYEVGSRVRLQDVKSKLFSTFGTVLEQTATDSGDIVSYIIKCDRGHTTTRHRKFMRELAPEHDPRVINYNNYTNLDRPTADRDILGDVATEVKAPEKSESDGREEIGTLTTRRSGRLKGKGAHIGAIKAKVFKVSTSSHLTRMGQSCSTQLEAEKAKNKQLLGRIKL